MAKTPRKSKKSPATKKTSPIADAWGELRNLSNAAAGMLSSASQVSALFKNPEALKKVQDKQKLNALGRVLLNDLTNFNTRLTAIKDRHINQPPPKDDGDAAIIAIEIGQDYQQWMEDYNTVIPITTAQILELTEGRSAEEVEANAAVAKAEIEKQQASAPGPTKMKQTRVKPATTPKKTLDLMALARGKKK